MTAHGTPPAGFARRETRVHLGHGEEVFERAVAGLNAWAVYPPWMTLYPEHAPVERGTCVAISVGWGLHSLSAVRVVEVRQLERSFSFTLGTLPQHAVSGEERFAAIWHTDDSVRYELTAVSRPHHLSVKLGSPVLRLVRRRFARDSVRSLRAFIERLEAP